ncbi:AAA family ATPase [Myroides odoratimimus]|uniref:AAA family ATPase n=1 Tax=Myroides odoratimimus TaxID=76832 RepID=UPI00073F5341|nr:AAA family ATPase [Myroides odoratimimus]STZ49485.1 Uncharacterized protein conserved in bacteria [Myroides odoratimimus]
MIKKIDIDTFGLYKNYKWDTVIGKNETFRRVNIIYGRNYSGKTTLSRILKCVENKQLHPNYSEGKFQIFFENNHITTENNLEDEILFYKIRVYNTDFVKENLSWLHNEDGSITVSYSLTEHALESYPVLESLIEFGQKHRTKIKDK